MLIKIVDLRTEERKARDLARVDHIALAALVTVALVTPETALAAYQKGSLMKKAQPIIDLLKFQDILFLFLEAWHTCIR
jgi:p-aminobenzoyl-glutamate transporter AbgT